MKIRIGKWIVALRDAPEGTETIDEGLYGMEAELLDRGTGWVKIRMFYGYDGWVPEETVVSGEFPLKEGECLRCVGATFADVKAQPEVQAETLLCLPRGAWLTVGCRPENGCWMPVRLLDGRCGYLPQAALTDSVQEAGKIFRGLPEEKQRKKLAETALSYLNAPYRWGGKTPLGIDCSGLAQMTYLLNGVIIYRDAKLEAGFPVKSIPREAMGPGDLLYFPGHIAVYLGNQKYVHATAAADRHRVTVNSLNPADEDYREDLAGSLRMVGSIYR